MADKKITIKRRRGFTIVPNSAFDGSLPLSAIGLYAYMLSRPDNWEFTVSGMAVSLGVGRDAVRSALLKLERAGFLLREQSHNEKGLFSGNVYVLYDEKVQPLSENPSTEKPSAGKPSAENPTQSNNRYIQEGSNTPPVIPLSGRRKRKEPRSAPDWKPERFAGLWEFYPKEGRKDKQRAMDAWDKLKPDDALIRKIGQALTIQMRSEMWQKGVGIPYVATYLNGRRWEDVTDADAAPRAESRSGWSEDAEVVASW